MELRKSDESTSAVDLFKLFFAICIMLIHTSFFSILSDFGRWLVTSIILRMGVPYFFISSGYFYWKKVLKSPTSIEWGTACAKKYINRNIWPFLFFGTASLIINAALALHRNGLEGLVSTIHNAVFYPLGAMWFVASCMVAVVLITGLNKQRQIVLFMGCLGYMFALLCNTYYFLVEGTMIGRFVDLYLQYFVSARNGIFIGVFLFGIGTYLADKGEAICKKLGRSIYLLLGVTLCLQIVESILLYGNSMRDDASLYLTMPVLSALVFLVSLMWNMPYGNKTSLYLRRLSGYVYFIHPLLNASIGTVILITVKSTMLNTFVIASGCMIVWFLTRNSDSVFIRKILP